MSLFIGFIFWYLVVAVVITMLGIVALPHPRQQTKTIGQEMLGLVFVCGLCIWAGLLHFGLIK